MEDPPPRTKPLHYNGKLFRGEVTGCFIWVDSNAWAGLMRLCNYCKVASSQKSLFMSICTMMNYEKVAGSVKIGSHMCHFPAQLIPYFGFSYWRSASHENIIMIFWTFLVVRRHAVRATCHLPCICVLSKRAFSNYRYMASNDCVILIKECLHNSQVGYCLRGPKGMFFKSTWEELELKHYIFSGKLLSQNPALNVMF